MTESAPPEAQEAPAELPPAAEVAPVEMAPVAELPPAEIAPVEMAPVAELPPAEMAPPAPARPGFLASWGPRLQTVALALFVTGGIVLFGAVVHAHYPIGRWLFWRYLLVWSCVSVWLVGCVSVGYSVISRFLPRLPLRESLVQSSAVGIYLFYASMVVGGLLHLYGHVFAVGLPLAFVAVGVGSSWKQGRRIFRRIQAFRKRPSPPRSLLSTVVVLYGVVCIGALYFNILTPKNANFDSQWYHLGLGQQWMAQGGMLRTPEGWFVEALPHFAAVLYAWAFQLPKLDLFNIVEVAAHIEFVIFLLTLAGIPVLVYRLVPGARTSETWVAMFLFPSLFIYDASLHTGNDHIAAFWAVPIFLALRRAYATMSPRHLTLVSLGAAGAILTKYQAASLVVAPAVAILFRGIYLLIRRRKETTAFVGPVVCLVTVLLFTSPHWLKNLLWYGDPLYPALHKHLALRPWHPDLSAAMDSNWERLVWRPKGPLLSQLKETFAAGWTFSFVSHARSNFHGKLPEFGSLFTLSLLWLPFLRRTRNIWALFACAQVGVFSWYYLSHVERYLQALIPWMAAVVAAGLILLWRKGLAIRIPAGGLCALQVIWGGDAYFFPTHAMLGGDVPVRVVAQLMATGYTKDFAGRTNIAGSFQEITAKLPPKAVVLLHEFNPRLGLRASIVTDMPGFQGLLRYGRFASTQEIVDAYKSLGISHVVWRNGATYALDNLAGDLRFFDLVTNWTESRTVHGSMALARMKNTPPAKSPSNTVVYLGCNTFTRGVYKLADMDLLPGGRAKPPLRKLTPRDPTLPSAIEEAGFIVRDSSCPASVGDPASYPGFINAVSRSKEELWIRQL